MDDVLKQGGCPVVSNMIEGSSPLPDISYRSSNSFTRCPICQGNLSWGSDEPAEDKTYYWCENCGIIHSPLYSKPVPKIAPVIDAEAVQRKRPVIIAPPEPSPHAFLDDAIAGVNIERRIVRSVAAKRCFLCGREMGINEKTVRDCCPRCWELSHD